MNDIVEKLRSAFLSDENNYGIISDLPDAAADEIERLRRERDDEERRANILSDAIDYVLNVSHEGLPWLDDWFHGEPDAMHELDAWRARSRAALGEEKK